jgi:DNA repair exonuclease SbcCD ATPase subunit
MDIACSICLDSFTLTSNIYTTPCGHVFHYKCVRRWLESGNQGCSQCRWTCKISQITKLHFSENESVLEKNNVYTQLETENLRLDQEVNALKAQKIQANQKCNQLVNALKAQKLQASQKCTQLEFENTKLQQEVYELKARESESNQTCINLKEENKKLHKTFCLGRSNSAGMDRVLKEQRKEIIEKGQKIIELKDKVNKFEELDNTVVNGLRKEINSKAKKINELKDKCNQFQELGKKMALIRFED